MNEQVAPYHPEPQVSSEAQDPIPQPSGCHANVPEELVWIGEPAAVAVYGVLDRLSRNPDGSMPVNILQTLTHFSRRRVQLALLWLEAMGYIRIVRHRAENARRVTEYQLLK